MSKYIDADKLIAILNDRIERCEKDEEDGYPDTTSSEATLKSILYRINSLQQEQPEPFSCSHENGYDEAYLQEKIAKASKTWKGVDVDKFMDEVRGREQEQPEVKLEEFTEKMNAWKARYNHPDNIPIKATMAFTARMFYQCPNVARQWYESLPKAIMD